MGFMGATGGGGAKSGAPVSPLGYTLKPRTHWSVSASSATDSF